jgi:hypothetical protein
VAAAISWTWTFYLVLPGGGGRTGHNPNGGRLDLDVTLSRQSPPHHPQTLNLIPRVHLKILKLPLHHEARGVLLLPEITRALNSGDGEDRALEAMATTSGVVSVRSLDF